MNRGADLPAIDFRVVVEETRLGPLRPPHCRPTRLAAGRSLGARAMDGGDEGYAFDFEEVVDDAERAASDFLPSAHDAIPSSSAPFGDRPRDGAGSVRTDAFDETLALIPLPEGADEALRLDFKSRYFDPARALAAKPPGLDPPRKVRPLENTRRFRRLLPANDPARLDVSVSRAPTRGATPGFGSSKDQSERRATARRPRRRRRERATARRSSSAERRARASRCWTRSSPRAPPREARSRCSRGRWRSGGKCACAPGTRPGFEARRSRTSRRSTGTSTSSSRTSRRRARRAGRASSPGRPGKRKDADRSSSGARGVWRRSSFAENRWCSWPW